MTGDSRRASVQSVHGPTQTQVVFQQWPSPTELEPGQQAESAPQGPGVTGTVESGRPPTGGPVRSDRKEPRSSRVTTSLRDFVPLREELERYSSQAAAPTVPR